MKGRRIRALALALLIIFHLCALTSCTTVNEPPKNRLYYDYFDTVCVVYDYTGGTVSEFDAVCELVEEELSLCHRLFDIYNEYDGINNLMTVNSRAGGEPVSVDGRIIELLELSKDVYELTDGHTNVAMGAVLSLWHRLRSEAKRIPTEQELDALRPHISIDSIVIDKERGTVTVTDPLASIDVGAVAKGYCAERIATMLTDMGIEGYVLNLGGNLRFIGEHPKTGEWEAKIENPRLGSDEPYIRVVKASDCSLVTSGSYQRFYTVEGVRYHHIINKDTLMPENYYLSVTVMTESSAMADALSTALFNMPEDEVRGTVERIRETYPVEVTLVFPSGEVIVI